jgi:hypothetical protein
MNRRSATPTASITGEIAVLPCPYNHPVPGMTGYRVIGLMRLTLESDIHVYSLINI